MTKPSSLVLAALLLGAAFVVTDDDRVRVGAVVVAWTILLLVAARALYRRSPRLAGWVALALVGAVAIAATAALLTLSPPLRSTYRPDVPIGTGEAEVVAARGFYGGERDTAGNPFVWTQGRATLVFDLLVHRPVTLTVEMRSAALAGGPDAPVAVIVNGQQVGALRPDPTRLDFQPLSVRFVPPNWAGEQTEIRLVSAAFKPAGGDPRELGTMVRAVTLDTTEAWSGFTGRGAWLRGLVGLCAVLVAAAFVLRRRVPARAALARIVGTGAAFIGSATAAALVAIIWRIGPVSPAPFRVGLVAGGTLALFFAGVAVVFWAGLGWVRVVGSWGGAAVAPFARFVRPVVADVSAPATGVADGRGVRRDLVWVFVVALAVRVVWALLVPPWLAPDEPDHYVYAAHIAEQGLPYPPVANLPAYPEEFATSANLALTPKLSAPFTGTRNPLLPFFPIYYDYTAAQGYSGTHTDRLSEAGARATAYPPLYYLLAAVPYRLAYDTPVLSRLYAVRLASAVLGALSCVCGYLLAWELRRSRQWGWALGLCMALMPMYVFTNATVNNDAALNLFCTALCWLVARLGTRTVAAPGLMFALGATVGAVIATKPTGYGVVVPAVALIFLWVVQRLWRERQTPGRHLVGVGAGAVGVAFVALPWGLYRWYVASSSRVAADAPPAWLASLFGASSVAAADTASRPVPLAPVVVAEQMYSLGEYFTFVSQKAADHWHWLLVRSFWGIFGWLDVPMPNRAYAPITIAVTLCLIGVAGVLLVQPARRPAVLLALAFVAGHIGFLFFGADYFEVFRRSGSDLGLQGRYFFPVLAPFLFLLLSGWQFLLRDRAIGLRLAPLAMLAAQLAGLATLVAAYYGVTFG